ncbi:cell wall metabolism sensor histidine kinase WalK [Clostridium estertheticum]|uniref:HAMP domain-containing sensor histidine kinase n=1 Tax=Clostridium estertheticum TaxID=238834 RepID=UPI001C7D3010|nr:ATP-binding protein [Clostridium estertheticum]MBX4259645.1 cell wall metabolism sensor histidine kinase WalK [Clostridium estertheticum]WLC70531.1 cell wall metabolism sensor histidine kinase WalK [Clostridium estertheticum]
MKEKEQYLNIKSSYVKIIFIVMLIFILISIGLTITLDSLYGQYIKEKIKIANQIIFGVNTGILCSMLVTLVVVGPAVLFASKKMASPLVEMKKVAIAMSEGDFSIRAKENYSGEIGQLAVTLNKLAAELSNTINSLIIEGDVLKQILNSMSDGLLGFDLNQKVNLKNFTFEEMFEVESNLEELQNDVQEVIYKVSLSAIENQKTEIATCSVKEKSILISGSPIRSEDNSIIGTVLLFRDVTEAIRLEQTRRDYVANVSHELRSPLTAVKGLIIPLKEGMVKDEDKRNHFYEVIYNEVERLNRLVNDLFELSRLQSRNEPFDMQVVDLTNILCDQQDKFEMVAEEKNIKLIVKNSKDSIYAKGNIDRIGQVLTILIDNAFKFAKVSSTITLCSKNENGRAIVSVHNTGSLIKNEDLPFIFDRFYKVDKAHKEEGAGLGLSIAKEVVMRINGNIHVKSDGKNETCFSFDLELD